MKSSSTKPQTLSGPYAFIARTCGSDEKLIMGAHMHWIVLVIGAAWFGAFTLAGFGASHLLQKFILTMVTPQTLDYAHMLTRLGTALQSIGFGIGFAFFLCYYIVYDTTHIGLTTKRLIMRRGLLFVKLKEIDLEEIKSETVDHGMLGRFLDYGEVSLDARFVENFRLPHIADPYRLLRAMHEVRAKVGDTVGNPAVVAAAPIAPAPIAVAPATTAPAAAVSPTVVPAAAPQATQPPPVTASSFVAQPKVEVLDETSEYVIYKETKPLPA